MIHVQCKGCGKGQLIEGGDVHEAVDAAGCTCCPIDHHHGEAANRGVPCRPLLITVMGPVDDEDELTAETAAPGA
jgi:hypothetical protein